MHSNRPVVQGLERHLRDRTQTAQQQAEDLRQVKVCSPFPPSLTSWVVSQMHARLNAAHAQLQSQEQHQAALVATNRRLQVC